MTDRARELLDKLMGPTRNLTNKELHNLQYSDNCIFLLIGLCPFKVLENTKWTIGKCPYNEHRELPLKYIPCEKIKKYEIELLVLLENIVGFLQNRKKKTFISKKNVSYNMRESLKKIDDMAKEGKIEEALKLAEELHKEEINKTFFCEICMTYVSNIIDSKEYKTHVDGKLHKGCTEIRRVLSRLLIKHKDELKSFLTKGRKEEIRNIEKIFYLKKDI